MYSLCKKLLIICNLILFLIMFFSSSCTKNDPVSNLSNGTNPEDTTDNKSSSDKVRPEGWEFNSHDKDASPDYDLLFAQNKVNQIEITISDSAWKTLIDDMTSMAGTFGAGGGMGGGPSGSGSPGDRPDSGSMGGMFPGGMKDTNDTFPSQGNPPGQSQFPQEFFDAAEGKTPGDSCSCTIMGNSLSGIVDTTDDGKLVCMTGFPQNGENGNIPDQGKENNNGGGMGANLEFLPKEPVYIPCIVKFNDKKWTNVGFRLKGNSSLVSAWQQGVYKLPFRIKTDQFEDSFPEIKDQRMYGFQDIAFANSYNDNTMVHEKVACDMFRDFGVPAPKSAFVRLYIDYGEGRKYFGLYTIDEVPDNPMFMEWFGNNKGNLYKPEGDGANFVEFDYNSFEEKNNGNTDCSDIKSLFTALHADRNDTQVWRNSLESVFNVDIFLKWLAVNTSINNWDAYGQMAHNYYLYNNSNRLTWIAWDLGLSFTDNSSGSGASPMNGNRGNSDILHDNTNSSWPLISYLLDDEVYRKKYIENLRSFLIEIFSPDAANRVQSAYNMISPYISGTEQEQSGYTFLKSPQDFESAHSNLRQFISTRITTIDSVLNTVD